MELFPKDIDFFEVFDRDSLKITKASVLLVAFMEKFDRLEERAKEIYEVEQEGDALTHEIMKKLNKAFITPIDREDLYALDSSLDDILDVKETYEHLEDASDTCEDAANAPEAIVLKYA